MMNIIGRAWEKHSKDLEERIKHDIDIGKDNYEYIDLLKYGIVDILNPELRDLDLRSLNDKIISQIDDGQYQGTLLFLIPLDVYQPASWEYLITYVEYGSCTVCDTLLSIDEMNKDDKLSAYLMVTKDMLCNMMRPYKPNNDWYFNDKL